MYPRNPAGRGDQLNLEMTIQEIKQRFGIIGGSQLLDHAINIARQVAPTDITVLITGESGVGKEVFPQIIHHLSSRKHGPYIAVNCGAIPEGTIDSELFGHEKGSFTGAHESRKGYFEVVTGGTIFLDEVAELPLSTQVRLLRVLETGEFIRVGSSKVQKTDVRVVAATNVNMPEAIEKGRFREDLYYRLNTVPIQVPSLRQRKEDILLLFRKFTLDFADKYRMPPLQLYPEAQKLLTEYRWPGNIRQLKNIAEQISILEKDRNISPETLLRYLPPDSVNNLPVLIKDEHKASDFNERDLLYKVLFEMKKDIIDLKKLVVDLIQNSGEFKETNAHILKKLYQDIGPDFPHEENTNPYAIQRPSAFAPAIEEHEEVTEESLSLHDREVELIKKALEKYKGKRKLAARELGISERTLYRKINEYNIR
jgi:transcriptional regulator with PAS, ATPase and Fis domain